MIYRNNILMMMCLLLGTIFLGSCMNNQIENKYVTDKPVNESDENQTRITTSFQERLDANSQIQNIADEYAFAPPVPLAEGNHQVIVFAYMQADRTTVPKVLPPRYRITAEFPQLKVSSVETITPEQLGLTLIEGKHLGEVRLPEKYAEMSYDKFTELRKEFENVYSVAVEAYFNKTQPSASQCRRIIELLPVLGNEPLMPLLQKTNPAFFENLKRCAAV